MGNNVTERKPGQTGSPRRGRTVLWCIYLLVALVAVVVVCSMVYVHLIGSRVVARHVPWVETAMEIRLEATTAHLWFEELVGGDRSVTIDQVLEHLTNADRYAQAMLRGGDTSIGMLRPLDDLNLRAQIAEVRDKLAEFRQITLQRWQARGQSGVGTEIEQQSDAMFEDFMQEAHNVEAILKQFIITEFRDFKVVQALLIGTCLVVTVAIGSTFGYFVRGRLRAELALRATNQQFEASNQQLRATEQQLRASNQQLTASNQQLRASQEEIRSLAKFPAENPDAVLRVARDGVILHANQAAKALLSSFGAEAGSTIPGSWDVSVAEVLAEGAKKEVEVHTQGRTYLLVLAPVVEAEYVNVYGRDISERVAAENLVRQERDRAQQYLDIAGVILVALDRQGKVTLLNKKGCTLLGWDEAEALGKDWFDNFIPQDGRGEVRDAFNELIKGRLEMAEYFENSVLASEGSTRIITWHNTILRDEAGHVVGTLSSGEDVTDRKKADAQLKEHQTQLRSLVSQLTTTEERERKELAGILHDDFIQNLALCKMRLEQARAVRTMGEARAIQDSAIESISELIAEMRTVTFELCSPVLYTVGLEAAIQDWLDNQVRGKHDTEFLYGDDGQTRHLDEDVRFFLFRAARELCTNVIKHADAKTANVSIRTEGGMVRIDVEDDGIGMIASEREGKGDESGGLGLFGIRERLDYFDGTMQINAKAAGGTHITITAPLARP